MTMSDKHMMSAPSDTTGYNADAVKSPSETYNSDAGPSHAGYEAMMNGCGTPTSPGD